MSKLGWIHFSHGIRDRVNTILDMMEEEGVVDELGMGVFRDAFANKFFPGISTIQTRAKYFFIVPYLIRDYMQVKSDKGSGLSDYLLERENEIMWDLAAKYDHNRNARSGVIGITKIKPARIARRPSSIYWNGIRQFGLIRTSLSLSEYIVRIDDILENRVTRKISTILGESDDPDVDISEGHEIKVTTYRAGWEEDLDMPLDFDEAEHLRNRIIQSVKGSLLGMIVSDNKLRRVFLNYSNFLAFARASVKNPAIEKLKADIVFAHDLSELVRGIHFIYSNEINNLHYQDDIYLRKWEKWKEELSLLDAANLSSDRLLEIAPKASFHTIEFIRELFRMVRENDLNYQPLSQLVRKQEQDTKKQKSRFRPDAEIDFRKGEGRGLPYLNYRYTNAKTIVNDIFNGLKV